MGYTTDFQGAIKITPTLSIDIIQTVNALARGRNNEYGDGYTYAFDSVIHHLRGHPDLRGQKDEYGLPMRVSMFEAKRYGASKAPSCWCQWELINDKQQGGKEETYIVWDEGEKFYEYMYWLQYFIDFVTIYVKEQYGIEIESCDGSIHWEGEYENYDYGILSVYRRETPELTDFYPEDFLPLPTPPSDDECHSSYYSEDDEAYYLKKPSAPKGEPSMSTFGVKARIYPEKPLQLCYMNYVKRTGAISRGGYLLFAHGAPNNPIFSSLDNSSDREEETDSMMTSKRKNRPSLDLYVHHEKAKTVYDASDPTFSVSYFSQPDAKWALDDKAIERWENRARMVATFIQPRQIKSLKHITADMLLAQDVSQDSKDTIDSTAVDDEIQKAHVEELISMVGYRQCTECGGRMEGPAHKIAVWRWHYGYDGANVYAIYCSPQCFNKFEILPTLSS